MTHGYGFDVALVKLARPVILGPGRVWPACLPEQGKRVSVGKLCFITGKFQSVNMLAKTT